MTDANYYTETISAFRSLADNGACRFPREPYNPHDLLPHQHEALRAAWYRAARRDGLDEDAAEEAASWAYARWLCRDYSKHDMARGDHLRSWQSVRRFAKLSHWQGFNGLRRDRRRKITAENLARQERMREQHNPRPADMATAWERVEWSSRLRLKAIHLMQDQHLESFDDLLRMAAGVELPQEDVTDTTTVQTDAAQVPRRPLPRTDAETTPVRSPVAWNDRHTSPARRLIGPDELAGGVVN